MAAQTYNQVWAAQVYIAIANGIYSFSPKKNGLLFLFLLVYFRFSKNSALITIIISKFAVNN